MVQHARSRATFARDSEVRIDRIEFQLVGNLAEELPFKIAELGLDRPHELNGVGDKSLERLESVAQLRPSVGRIEQSFESRLRPCGKNHANRRVAAGIRKSVERDIDAL